MVPTDPLFQEPLSEVDIQAYADGMLPSERTAHVRRYLKRAPAEARRVAFYGKLNQQLRRRHMPADDAAPGDLHLRPQSSRRAMIAKQMATLALALVVALACVWLVLPQVTDEILDNAAVTALTEVGNRSATTSSNGNAALPTPAPDLPAPDFTRAGLRPVAAKTVRLTPFAHAYQFVYLNVEGKPVVLLVARALPTSHQQDWGARRLGQVRLLTWVAAHRHYVLAGQADVRGLMRAADIATMH